MTPGSLDVPYSTYFMMHSVHVKTCAVCVFIKQQYQSRSLFCCNFMHFASSRAFKAEECNEVYSISAVDWACMLSTSFTEKKMFF